MASKLTIEHLRYRRAIDELSDTLFWREYHAEMARTAMIRLLRANRVGRQAGRAALALSRKDEV